MSEQRHEGRNATEDARLLLGGVIHITEVLEVGCRIGLHYVVGITQEVNHLMQVWVPPPHWGEEGKGDRLEVWWRGS